MYKRSDASRCLVSISWFIQYSAYELHAGYLRLQTHTQNTLILNPFPHQPRLHERALNFLDTFKNSQTSNFMENPSSGCRVLPRGERTDMTKLIVAFRKKKFREKRLNIKQKNLLQSIQDAVFYAGLKTSTLRLTQKKKTGRRCMLPLREPQTPTPKTQAHILILLINSIHSPILPASFASTGARNDSFLKQTPLCVI